MSDDKAFDEMMKKITGGKFDKLDVSEQLNGYIQKVVEFLAVNLNTNVTLWENHLTGKQPLTEEQAKYLVERIGNLRDSVSAITNIVAVAHVGAKTLIQEGMSINEALELYKQDLLKKIKQ